jgi:hypothetical protein
VVELDGKATCTGDKHFSLSFSCCALPQVTGEKKVRAEASVAIGWRGCGGWRATVEACGRTMGRAGGGARATETKEQGTAASLRRIGRRPTGAAHGPSPVGGSGGSAHIEIDDLSTILYPAIHMKSNGYKKGDVNSFVEHLMDERILADVDGLPDQL